MLHLKFNKQALPKVIWEEPHHKVPISYNEKPKIQPQICPFPLNNHNLI